MVNICFCTDGNQIDFALSNILNISKQSKNPISFFLLVKDIDYIDIEKIKTIRAFISNFNSENQIILKFFDFDLSSKIFSSKIDHITSATFMRLFIPEILENVVGSLLYLDNDTFVDGDIAEIKTIINKGGNYAQSLNIKSEWPKKLAEILQRDIDKYYNAGVLILDLDKLRKENFVNQAKKFLDTNHSFIEMGDQDVLNSLVKFKDISSNYNIGRPDWPKHHFDYENGLRIFHFISYAKPWNSHQFNIELIDENILGGRISLNHYFRNYQAIEKWKRSFEFYSSLINLS